MSSRNDRTIVVTRRGTFREIFGYAMAFFAFAFVFAMMFLMMVTEHESSDGFQPGVFALIFGAGAVFMLGALVRHAAGTKAVFDLEARRATLKAPFGKTFAIGFDDIARLAPVVCKTIFSEQRGFCLVPKNDPVFGTRRFSPLFRKGSAKLSNFESTTLLEIERVAGLEGVPSPSQSRTPVRPEEAGYAKQSGRYVKNSYRRLAAGAVTCIVLLLAGIKLLAFEGEDLVMLGLIMAIGALAGLVYVGFMAIRSIEIDVNRNTLEIRRGLLLGRTKPYPFEKIESFEIASFYGNWFTRNQRSLALRIAGVKKAIPLSGATKTAGKLRSELLLLAELTRRDPLRDVNYVETRVG